MITTKSHRFWIILTTFSLLILGCTTKYVKELPPFDWKATLSKGIDVQGMRSTPLQPTSRFSTEDPEVIAHVKFKNLSGRHSLRWEWLDPNRNPYYSTRDFSIGASSEERYLEEATAWHRISISGEKAAKYPGQWRVNVYLNNKRLTSLDFRIEEEINVDKLPKIAQRQNPNDWGLIIGIENYANFPPCEYGKRDALLMKDYLMGIFGVPEENIISLIDEKASRTTIGAYLTDFFPKHVGKDSNLYVYFAGHGLPDMTAEKQKRDAYLVPYDGDTRFITKTGYKLRSLYEDLSNLKIQRSYVFLDACFSGAIAGFRPALIHVEEIQLLSDKVISLTASTGGEMSHSYPEKGHGLFTYFLLRGLRGEADSNGDSEIDLEELYDYVRSNVIRVSGRLKGIDQTPAVSPSFDMMKGIKDLKVCRVPR